MNEYLNAPNQEAPDMAEATGTLSTEAEDGLRAERIIEALEATVVTIERLIANRSREELQQAAQDGGWGVVEILAHIHDWEEVAHERVRSILEEDHPSLEDYDDTLWAIEHDYGSQDGHTIFLHISTLRHGLIERLRELEERAWHRQATLCGHGDISLFWLMEKLVKHDTKHLEQARDVFG